MTAYEELLAFSKETAALSGVVETLGWDQETMMPRKAAEQRGDQFAALESVIHARNIDPRVGEWLAKAEAPDATGAAILREVQFNYDRSVKVPAALATEIARVTSVAQGKWVEARGEGDFKAFAPVLKEVVRLRREEGAALADGGDAYDALLEGYEPGTSSAQIAEIFDAMRPRLVALREKVLAQPEPAGVSGTFDPAIQLQLSEELAKTFGYDMERGRIDKAVHPFCAGHGFDVRITTRTNPADPFNCFYSTIHEVGHACYEQTVRDAYAGTPIGRGVSMGVHESQSRIYENQLGRSRAFTGYLFGKMRDAFGDFGIANEDDFYAAVNRVEKGYIRTEADELQYNLHIMMRFDLEMALIRGELEVDDLEAAWNERFEKDFGYPVDTANNGVLQDVHWSAGLFGYFPTYALGNVYAGNIYSALRDAVPSLDDDLSKGDLSNASAWLGENLQQNGALYTPRETVAKACGFEPTAEPLLGYLETKFGGIYGL